MQPYMARVRPPRAIPPAMRNGVYEVLRSGECVRGWVFLCGTPLVHIKEICTAKNAPLWRDGARAIRSYKSRKSTRPKARPFGGLVRWRFAHLFFPFVQVSSSRHVRESASSTSSAGSECRTPCMGVNPRQVPETHLSRVGVLWCVHHHALGVFQQFILALGLLHRPQTQEDVDLVRRHAALLPTFSGNAGFLQILFFRRLQFRCGQPAADSRRCVGGRAQVMCHRHRLRS